MLRPCTRNGVEVALAQPNASSYARAFERVVVSKPTGICIMASLRPLHDESFVRLSQVPQYLPTRVSTSTVWRWATKGVGGIVLESTVIGGVRHTSQAAIDRFLAAVNECATKPCQRPQHPRQSRESVARAEQILRSAGI